MYHLVSFPVVFLGGGIPCTHRSRITIAGLEQIVSYGRRHWSKNPSTACIRRLQNVIPTAME